MYGDFRSTNSATARSARSTADPDSTTASAGSASITVCQVPTSANPSKISAAWSHSVCTRVGSNCEPERRCASSRAAGRAARAVGHLDVLGDLHDPRRHRSRVTGDLAWPALPVPPLIRARQRLPDLSGQVEPHGQLPGKRGVLGEHVVDIVPPRDGEPDAGPDPVHR